MPLVAFVEDDDVDARQLLVPLQPLQQHTGRDDLHACVPPHGPFAAHGEPHPLAGPLTQQPRHPPGRRPGRDPARLRHHDAPRGTAADQPRQDERYQRRLARAGRRHEHGGAGSFQGLGQGRQGGTHGQRVQGVVTDHAP